MMPARIFLPMFFGAGMLAACQSAVAPPPATPEAVVATYVSLAEAVFEDSLLAARKLDASIERLLAQPSQAGLEDARQAWREARIPYLQTEVFRFGNRVVDEWEGRVNSWPLDEGLIDYTANSYGSESDNNLFYSANIIANPILNIGGLSVDASHISPSLLAETLHQIDGVETNVATGYHALEFLLWGQDLNGSKPGAGQRPYTDFSPSQCSHGHCERRGAYLKAVSTLLVSDLEEMLMAWRPGGAAREEVMARGEAGGLVVILTGMGSLAFAELAGERIRLPYLLHDPEEEQDCFSDNTHYSHYYDALGIRNVYRGEYQRLSGETVKGPGLADLVRQAAPQLAAEMAERLAETESAMTALVAEARQGNTFDMLIGTGNARGAVLIPRILDALQAETRSIESVIAALGLTGLSLEGAPRSPAP
ncbi:MAG: imelysin family protein [Pseudomonadales bacterium]|nr:imelysin family protein [Pseudomonadales bacterium]